MEEKKAPPISDEITPATDSADTAEAVTDIPVGEMAAVEEPSVVLSPPPASREQADDFASPPANESAVAADASPFVSTPPPSSPVVAPAPAFLKPSWYYLIFMASGFAGLIYESVWARYLKLFLGHAAYAQALVLAIFLLGLAGGAALCARFSQRITRPLMGYVIIEILVAVIAVYFHEIYVAVQGWATDFVLPRIESDSTAELFKWFIAALLVFPQSLLLGATFPLMSAGLLRIWRDTPGRIISMLYFSNSIGAAIGVLVGGFVLVPFAGLPGTVAIAGFINAAAAAAVWVLGHRFNDTGAPVHRQPWSAAAPPPAHNLILTVAFVTGLASFIYEIIWVRMLSLLLGAATHTFEIMLSVFILGLAVGGLLVRRYADAIANPLSLLGVVQLCMGAFALWSLFAFPIFYEILNEQLRTIPRDDDGYLLFTLLGLGLAALMMLPATICAGMTLPLLTRRLLDNSGEDAVGQVYAANTIGAISGVFIALHILLPHAGIQIALLTGAVLDMGLGVVLLTIFVRKSAAVPSLIFTGVVAVGAWLFGAINPQIAATGVFRSQVDHLPKVIYYKEGKTASITVTEAEVKEKRKLRTQAPPGVAVTETEAEDKLIERQIRTNGKIDAAIYVDEKRIRDYHSVDEITMLLLGLLPLLHKPDAQHVMNIGFGAGLTSRTILLSRNVQQLDNVEIEPAMVEGARLLSGRTAAVFGDTRNTFIYNDAKTVLARAKRKYDIIISEPSNPWVSGVANLFTKEFYRRVRLALADGGIFVQWLPLYETNPKLVGSVVRALSAEFADFTVYASANNNDVIFLATAEDSLSSPSNAVFADDSARAFLSDYNFHSIVDANVLVVGNKAILSPYFDSFNAPTNSDYYPYLENHAQRAFFKSTRFPFGDVALLPLPILEVLTEESRATDGITQAGGSIPLRNRAAGAQFTYLTRDEPGGEVQKKMEAMASMTCPLESDENTGYLENISSLMALLLPYADKKQLADVWAILETDACMVKLLDSPETVPGSYMLFWRAMSLRDWPVVDGTTADLLPYVDLRTPSGHILLLSAMMAYYRQENYPKVVSLLQELPLDAPPVIHHAARLLAANAAQNF